ncbi:hypothetical protein VHA01S_029_00300 [Vibrio halioticoli NBRC 102217]|uniref:Lipoprotein n=1 Tax=Vibrio halioticoli NBRC 102217 TaxID=1219072 RepID=V5FM15_9VIBR|nr:hypothetical protein [Vibrio halioticoli]GAD89897.1 hypothetical protein VHA01S_029_00300 [Vibrio halioticoli NBRC 102217]
MKCAKTITCSVIFLIAGCQSIPVYVPDHTVFVDGDTLVYDGMISGEAVLEALRAVRESNTPVKKLTITSQGGDISAGIELGFFIKEQNWDVEVSYAFLPALTMCFPPPKASLLMRIRC